MMTPTDWMPNGIATDCLWYDEFQGNEMCSKHGCSLGIDEDSPCFLCSDYVLYERGNQNEKERTRILFFSNHLPVDRNGQYYIDGM